MNHPTPPTPPRPILPETKDAYRINFYLSKLSASELQTAGDLAWEMFDHYLDTPMNSPLWATLSAEIGIEKKRREHNKGDGIPQGPTRPAIVMLHWSDADVAGALSTSSLLAVREEPAFTPNVKELLRAVNRLCVIAAAVRLRNPNSRKAD